jgi:hypothetical protein
MMLKLLPMVPDSSLTALREPRKRGGACFGWLVGLALAVFCLSSQAQWLTQTNVIRPGWTAVYFNVDPSVSGLNLDQLVGSDPSNPIAEIWLWKAPVNSSQYVTTPEALLSAGSYWVKWVRNSPATPNALETLIPNNAYLIHSTATGNYTWRVQGKPAPPSYLWDISGLNLIGFSTPAANPPSFQNFLAPAASLAGIVELYQYTGGNLVSSVNPGLVFSQYLTKVTRGQAFWIRATNVNNTYFGPFQVALPNPSGLSYGTSAGQFTLQIQNSTAGTMTVSANLLASETPPYGQTPIVGTPPLLVRGALNASNLTYACTSLAVGSPQSWTLAPQGQSGASVQVVLGVNRYAMTSGASSLYAGILRFTDSLGLSQVDVPVSAQSISTAGLWVGNASITQVGSYLKSYQTDANSNLVVNTNGSYVVTGVNTNLGAVPVPYPLRLILFNDGTNCSLLQRVYYGLRQDTNLVVATTESVLDASHLNTARRISATQLPWTAANSPWPCSGQLGLGGVVSTTVTDSYDDQAANPFLHTYHPDHNNLDSSTTPPKELPIGTESYAISRQITLNVQPNTADFLSLTTANGSLTGTYSETITLTGAGARVFATAGSFSLTSISPIATLTTH